MEQLRNVQQQHATIRPSVVLEARGPPGMQGTRKLRESCISCSRSKVKCDKQKATCGRCVRRGLPCEFMVSRRTGRTRVIGVEKRSACQPPGDLQASPITTCDDDIACDHALARSDADNCSGLHHYLPTYMPLTPSNTIRDSSHCTHLLSPPDEADLWNSILEADTPIMPNILPLPSLGRDLAQLGTLSPSYLNNLDNVSYELLFHGSEMPSLTDPVFTSLMEGMETSNSLLNMASPMQSGSCCFAVCLNLLRRLFPSAHVGSKQSGHDGLTKPCTIEAVIEDNKQILDTVQAVLECQCGDDEYVAALVCLIVIRVLGWHIAVARDPPAYPQDQAFSSTSSEGSGLDSRRPSISSSEEDLLYPPVLVGSYSVYGQQQRRMAAQLVLSELYRVQRVVFLIGRRLDLIRHQLIGNDFGGSTSPFSSSLPEASGGLLPMAGTATPALSSSTLNHLEEDLRSRLRAVASEIIDILRQA